MIHVQEYGDNVEIDGFDIDYGVKINSFKHFCMILFLFFEIHLCLL